MEKTKYLQGKLKEYLYASSKLTADFVIAKTILDNIQNFPNIYLKQIATDAQVAESTVTKFCHKLGYDGFKELRNDILLEENTESIENMLNSLAEDTEACKLAQIILAEEKTIMLQAIKHFDFEKMDQIAKLIAQQKKGLILSPIYMTESITFFEEFLRKKTHEFYFIARSSDIAVIEECLTPTSLILIFSIKGEWVQNNQQLLQKLYEQGHKIVLFTCCDTILCPYIDIHFNVGEENLVGNQSAFIQYIYFKSLFLLITARC